MLQLEMTKDAKYAQKSKIQKQIKEKQQEALKRSQQDSVYDYFVRVSEEDGVLVEKVKKEKSYLTHAKESTMKLGESLQDMKGALYHAGAWVVEHGKFMKNPNAETHNSSVEEGKKSLQNVGNAIFDVGEGFALGIGSKLGEKSSSISAGSIQYGSQEEVFGRKEVLYDKTKGRTDLAVVSLTATAAEKGISKMLRGKPSSALRKQLESLGIKTEERALGIKIDGTTKTGLEIDRALGNNLGPTFKTFDHYDSRTKTAISVKSLNLDAKSYQNGSQMSYKLNKDVKTASEFVEYESRKFGRITSRDMRTRVVNIVVNDQKMNSTQLKNLKEVINYAKEKNVEIQVTIVK